MPTHQSGKCRIVTLLKDGSQKFSIRHLVTDGQQGLAKVLDDIGQWAGRHRLDLLWASLALYFIVPAGRRIDLPFLPKS
jgi:hypothetical protein